MVFIQFVEQFCVRFIRERILPGAGYRAGIEIIVDELDLAGVFLFVEKMLVVRSGVGVLNLNTANGPIFGTMRKKNARSCALNPGF